MVLLLLESGNAAEWLWGQMCRLEEDVNFFFYVCFVNYAG